MQDDPGAAPERVMHVKGVSMHVQELNFMSEAANAERCKSNLNSPRSHVRGRVTVCM